MGTTVPSNSLSGSIIVALWRDQLRAAVAAREIIDPSAATRPAKSPMVVTEFPDRNRHYPHIVVSELADVSGRPDIRADLWEHQYTVGLEIHAKTSTHVFRLRDQVRGWIESHTALFNAMNFHDAEIVSTTSMSWDPTDQVRSWRIAVRGTVYTAPPTEEET